MKDPASSLLRPLVFLVAAMLVGCSPIYDWREVRGVGAPYMIMLPAKPASYARPVTLAGVQVDMSMTGAKAGGATFAVGSVLLADAAQAQQALRDMKTAILRNINGKLKHERQLPGAALTAIEIEAQGSPDESGQSRLLLARFIMQERRVYQLVVLGSAQRVPPEAVDTFFSSFRPD